jgi:DNA-binding GntR family transcriptional regulator
MGFEPDPAGYVYVQLADYVQEQIAAGELTPGTRLLAESDMAAEYGVSLGSVRRVVRLLRERGVVVTLPSKGTFVRRLQRDS